MLYDYILTTYKVLAGLVTTKRLILLALGAFGIYILWICVALLFSFQRKFSSNCSKLYNYIRSNTITQDSLKVIDFRIEKISNGFFYGWKKFKTSFDETKGKLAISYYKCIACYGDYSLFRVRILTGRTHQIRVHLKLINCPILGDEVYSRIDKKFPKAKLMLHAKMLEIKIPNKPKPVRFKTKTPERFLDVIRVLKKNL